MQEINKFNFFVSLLVSFCISQHFSLDIEPTGEYQLIIFEEGISGLEVGDQIGIFDSNGILDSDGNTDGKVYATGGSIGFVVSFIVFVFGITDQPWAPAAYRINCIIIQLEKHLNDWDIIAIDIGGNSRLIRHNSVIYQLHCLIPPDTTGSDSNFFYHCPECNGHVYQCNCLRSSEFVQPKPETEGEAKNAIICPKCGGKIQKLGEGVLFCLDCSGCSFD